MIPSPLATVAERGTNEKPITPQRKGRASSSAPPLGPFRWIALRRRSVKHANITDACNTWPNMATKQPTPPATRILVMVAGTPNFIHPKRPRLERRATTNPPSSPARMLGSLQPNPEAMTDAIWTTEPISGAYAVPAITEQAIGKDKGRKLRK